MKVLQLTHHTGNKLFVVLEAVTGVLETAEGAEIEMQGGATYRVRESAIEVLDEMAMIEQAAEAAAEDKADYQRFRTGKELTP